MEVIRNYVEALFSSLPKRQDIVQMKLEMLENLEEKYNALLAEGKSEHEAAGAVIASIGTIDELRAGLGLPADAPAPTDPLTADPALVAEFKSFKEKMGVAIAVAVALFILAPVSYLIAENFFGEGIGIVLFFLLIAVGTGICIIFGVREDTYEALLRIEDGGDSAHTGRLTKLFSSIAFPIAAVIYLFLGFFADLWHSGWIIFVLTAVLTAAIAAIEEFRRR